MYAATIFPDRFKACGVELRPMTLGHALLLQRIGSPFAGTRRRLLEEPNLITYAHILALIFICSRSWRSADRWINTRWCSFWLRWKWVRCRHRIDEDSLAVIRWHQCQWHAPNFTLSRESKSGFERGTDFVHQLLIFCCRNMGVDHATAMDVPLAVASYDYLAHAEGEGSIRITEGTDQDLEALAIKALKEKEGGQNA